MVAATLVGLAFGGPFLLVRAGSLVRSRFEVPESGSAGSGVDQEPYLLGQLLGHGLDDVTLHCLPEGPTTRRAHEE